jgi:GTPase SAR1 family protein
MSKNGLKILQVKKDIMQNEFPNIKRPLKQPPFSLVLIAPTKSGKSNIIVNLLKNSYFGYDDVFEEIYYISPTVTIDSTLKSILEDDNIIKISDEDDLKFLDDILNDIVKNQKAKEKEDRKHVLIILDDCLDYLKKSKRLDALPSYSRHYKITLIITTQVYNALPTKLRKNINCFIISKIYNNKDLINIEEELGANFNNFKENYNKATEKKYDFLFVDNSEIELWHNFEELLWAK